MSWDREHLHILRILGVKYLVTCDDCYLCMHGIQFKKEGLRHWVNKIIKIFGVKFHLHQFRHTVACKLAEADVNLFKIQKMMGHTDIKMTSKYTRSMKPEDMGDDIAKISI